MLVSPINLGTASSLAMWAWDNRAQLANAPKEFSEFLSLSLANGGEGLQRIGSAIVLGEAGAGQRVLGFIDQAAPALERIDAAVNGLSMAQGAVSATLDTLQSLSMVTIGVSAITPLILAYQYRALTAQFSNLQKQITELQKMVDQTQIAQLQAGLTLLDQADDDKTQVNGALVPCAQSLHYFNGRLSDALSATRNRQVILCLARHLSVAICATSRCYIALGKDDNAQQTIEAHQPRLIDAAKNVFGSTVGIDPGKYLVPDLKEEVSFDFLQALFQQARYAKIDDSPNNNLEQTTSSRFFERLRPSLFKSAWFGPNKTTLLHELRQATASVEETSRILSLKTFLEEAERAGVKALDALKTLDTRKRTIDSPWVGWAF